VITFYQAEWCPWCHRVRQVLSELELTYTIVNVPVKREQRTAVKEISGQEAVPVLVDGDRVISDSHEIIHYLRDTYPAPEDVEDHIELGGYRWILELDVSAAVALKRTRAALKAEGFVIESQTRGDKLSAHLPREYVLLHVLVPAGAAEAVAVDPTIPTIVTSAMAVFPVEGGSVIAAVKPTAGGWLFGNPDLIKLGWSLGERMVKVFEALAATVPPASAPDK